ncbi:MAG: hypothetical protein HQ557_17160 [Bacteroidetes bacterium]|nr:hypothetical protein [Bacteroidota bacterium]
MGHIRKLSENRVQMTAGNGLEIVLAYKVVSNGKIFDPFALKIVGAEVEVMFDGCTLWDQVTENADKFVFNRKWEIHKPGYWALYFDVESELADAEVLNPAIMYNGNKSGKGLFPKGGLSVGWSFREDRMPVPSCSMVYNGVSCMILFTEPAASEEYISSILSKSKSNNILLSIRIPAEETPLVFNGKTSATESKNQTPDYLVVSNSDIPFTYKRKFYFNVNSKSDFNLPLLSYRSLVEALESKWVNPLPDSSIDWTAFVGRKLKNLLFLVQKNTDPLQSYFIMGRGNGDHQSVYEFTAGSFLVRSLDGAYLLAKTGLLTGRKDLLLKARQIGNFFLEGKRDHGLHLDNYDLIKDEWGGYLGVSENEDYKLMFNTRANGETMIGYICLYKQLLEAGIDIPEFLNIAIENAEFYLSHQLDNGSFGRWWDEQGNAVNADGTNGAHIVSFLLELEPYYSKPERIDLAMERAADYYGALIKNDEYYGDTLDADAYDRESGLVLLQMFLDLFQYKSKPEYLEYAKRVADFLLTWIWQYDVVFPQNTPLSQRSFHTSGMTSVSVAHHHLDFYGMQIGYDFLRLWKNTNIDIYISMGLKMIYACRQLVATADDPLGRSAEYEGWQPEQINHTAWEYFNRTDRQKGHFDICISWVTILELTTLFKLKEEFPEYINFEVRI